MLPEVIGQPSLLLLALPVVASFLRHLLTRGQLAKRSKKPRFYLKTENVRTLHEDRWRRGESIFDVRAWAAGFLRTAARVSPVLTLSTHAARVGL